MINFPVGLVTLTLAVLRPWIYLFLMTLVFVLQWFSHHLEILILLLSCTPLASFKLRRGGGGEGLFFHKTVFEYSHADWDGLCDHLRNILWEYVFKLGAIAAAEFWRGSRLELIYKSLIINIGSILIHFHIFQLLFILALLIEITSFVCTIE